MKRFHVHLAVRDLDESVRFYSTLFAAQPSVREHGYAKWMLDDPRVNFAISTRAGTPGIDHLGIQAEDAAELAEIGERLDAAGRRVVPEVGAECCYARSDKLWTADPQGTRWESFHTHGAIATYYGAAACGTGSARAGEADAGRDTATDNACCDDTTPQGVCCAPKADRAADATCCGPVADVVKQAGCAIAGCGDARH